MNVCDEDKKKCRNDGKMKGNHEKCSRKFKFALSKFLFNAFSASFHIFLYLINERFFSL